MSARRALELIKLMPKPKYTGWRSDRQKAEDARAEAKAAEAKAEAEAGKAEAEAAPMRLNQKKEEDEKESQQKKGAQNKDGVENDVNDDSDDEVLATQDKVDNTDRPIGKRCVEKQSPVIAGSDLRDRKKARVVAVAVSGGSVAIKLADLHGVLSAAAAAVCSSSWLPAILLLVPRTAAVVALTIEVGAPLPA